MAGLIIGFVVGHGLLADLITDEEREDVIEGQPEPLPTHVYLRAADDSWSIEAVFPKVRALPTGSYGAGHVVREYVLDIPELAMRRVRVDAQLETGQWYNVAGLFLCWLYLERRWQWAGKYIPWRFCSQLAVQLLRAGDIDACPGLQAGDVSPAHLEGWLAFSPLARREG